MAELSGLGTLAKFADKDPNLTYREFAVPVVRADDILPDDFPGALAIKIDVEGFECHVLRGMHSVLGQFLPAVITEIEPSLLERAGSTVSGLFEIMTGHGFRPYSVEYERQFPRLDYRFILREVQGAHDAMAINVMWLHPDSVHFQRLRRWMRRQ